MSSANASLSGSESAELRPSLATAATLLFVSSLTIMAATVISPGLPAIEAHFAGTENAAFLTRLLITMPALAIAFIAPFAGKFTDRFGRLRVLSASVLLYGLAGTSGLIADTLYALLFGRALLGAAVAGIVTATTALIGDLFAGPSRDRFMGLQTAFTGIGGLLFMSFGGLLAGAGWRAPFAIYGLALLILPAVLLCLTEPRYERQDSGASGPARVPLLAVSVLLLAAVFNSICFYLIPTQMPFHLYALGVNSPGTVGITLGAFNLAVAAASLGYGRLRAMVGLPGGFAVGFGVMAVSFAIIAMSSSHAAVAVGLMVGGGGLGCIMPGLAASAMTLAPPAARGRVAGALTASIFLGQFLSPVVSQPLVSWIGYAGVFGLTSVFLGIAAVLAALLALSGRSMAAKAEQG